MSIVLAYPRKAVFDRDGLAQAIRRAKNELRLSIANPDDRLQIILNKAWLIGLLEGAFCAGLICRPYHAAVIRRCSHADSPAIWNHKADQMELEFDCKSSPQE